jgi:hypothetical protein
MLHLMRLMFLRPLLFSMLSLLVLPEVQGQVPAFISRYVSQLVNDTSDISRPQFLVYPTLAYAPETSWEFGLSSLYVYYARRDTTNRLSEINGFTFITLENQYGIWFDHALYGHRNQWFLLGRLRFQSFPLLYYGIGPNTPSDYLARVDAKQIQIKERVLRKLTNNVYLGLEGDYQRLSSVAFVPNTTETLDLPVGAGGSSNLGLGVGLLYDNRHNILNVRRGLFSELAFLRYSNRWGSDHAFSTVISDTRLYRPVNRRDVLAAQLLGQFNKGDIPFNQMALLGGESLMRGYYTGRYRDNNLVAGQLEYRFLPLPLGFTNRLGAAVFGGAGTVFPTLTELAARDFVWSAGGGLRFLLFPRKDIFTRLDVAFTEEGSGFYLFIGEAF